jgi:hypothetical protein
MRAAQVRVRQIRVPQREAPQFDRRQPGPAQRISIKIAAIESLDMIGRETERSQLLSVVNRQQPVAGEKKIRMAHSVVLGQGPQAPSHSIRRSQYSAPVSGVNQLHSVFAQQFNAALKRRLFRPPLHEWHPMACRRAEGATPCQPWPRDSCRRMDTDRECSSFPASIPVVFS